MIAVYIDWEYMHHQPSKLKLNREDASNLKTLSHSNQTKPTKSAIKRNGGKALDRPTKA
jgi:hypothetical protein